MAPPSEERNCQYLVITGARAEEALRKVETWLAKLDLQLAPGPVALKLRQVRCPFRCPFVED
jgi:hypothetical protein